MSAASEMANAKLLFKLGEASIAFSMISDYMSKNNKPNFAANFEDLNSFYMKSGTLLFLVMVKSEQGAIFPPGEEAAEATSFASYCELFRGKIGLPFNEGHQAVVACAQNYANIIKQLAYKSAQEAILANDDFAVDVFKGEKAILWCILVAKSCLDVFIFSSLYYQGVAIVPNKIEVESSMPLSQTDFDGTTMQFMPRSDMAIMWVPNEDGSIQPGERITIPAFGEARAIRVSDPALQDYFMELATKQCAALS